VVNEPSKVELHVAPKLTNVQREWRVPIVVET